MIRTDFVHLRIKSHYSFHNSLIKIPELAAFGAGQKAVAMGLADESVLFGCIEFYDHCIAVGIIPILGMEMDLETDDDGFLSADHLKSCHHERDLQSAVKLGEPSSGKLLLYAKNQRGFSNICHLSTLANDGQKRVISRSQLLNYSQDLICISGFSATSLAMRILEGNNKALDQEIYWLCDIFGRDSVYLALENRGRPSEEAICDALIKAAHRIGIKPVVANPVQCLLKEDQSSLMALKELANIRDNRNYPELRPNWFMNKEEIARWLPDPIWLKNTVEIMEKCTFPMQKYPLSLPKFPVPEGKDSPLWLGDLCRLRLLDKGADSENARVRLDKELEIISKMGFCDYFLIINDLVQEARRRDIPISGRGSVAGSLVAWLLDIMPLNPLDYGLIFERFLNPHRGDFPDIDLDIGHKRKDELVSYLISRYGAEYSAGIISFGALRAKAALRECSRLLKIPSEMVDPLVKRLEGGDLKSALNDKGFARMVYGDKRLGDLMNLSMKIEGNVRNIISHPAGFILAGEPIACRVPLLKNQEGGIITQFTKDYIERFGLLKTDLLALKTLTIIQDAKSMIEKKQIISVADNALPMVEKKRAGSGKKARMTLDDPGTFDLLRKGRTLGIFQLESAGMTNLIDKFQPKKFQDLIAILALFRPGPLGSGMVEEFLTRRKGKRKRENRESALDKIVDSTDGIFLYQEQVMEGAMEIGGFSPANADFFRRAISSKDRDQMESYREKFVKGAKKKGFEQEKADEIFTQMAQFAGYGFNKSHSTAYAYLAYETAWLKNHHKVQYMCALLNQEYEERLVKLTAECRNMHIRILPPDIAKSSLFFKPEKNSIRFGLANIRNITAGDGEKLIKLRDIKENMGDAQSFILSLVKAGMGKRALESLIDSGALNSFGGKKSFFHSLVARHSRNQHDSHDQLAFDELLYSPKNQIMEELPEFGLGELLAREKEALGLNLSGHPLDPYEYTWMSFITQTADSLQGIRDGKLAVVGGIVEKLNISNDPNSPFKAWFNLQDFTGQIQCTALQSAMEELDWTPKEGAAVVIRGRLRVDRDIKSFIAERIVAMDRVFERMRLVVIINPQSESTMLALKEIISRYKGDIPLYISIESGGIKSLIHSSEKIRIDEKLMKEIDMLGASIRFMDITRGRKVLGLSPK